MFLLFLFYIVKTEKIIINKKNCFYKFYIIVYKTETQFIENDFSQHISNY